MSSPFGIALCGLGRMGQIHVDNISRNRRVKLLYIIEVDMEKARNCINDYSLTETTAVHMDNAEKAFTDTKLVCMILIIVLQNQMVCVTLLFHLAASCARLKQDVLYILQGVIICSPTDTHEKLVNLALEKDLHVLCEKPLSKDLEGSLHCYRKARSKGVVLLCAFNRRFDPQVQELYQRRNEVGKLHSVKTCSRDSPRPPTSFLKISGGVFHDCLVHDFDLLRWIIGEDPKTVYCVGTVHDPEIAAMDDCDTVMVVMEFPNGVLAHVDISRDCRYGYDQTVQVYGSNGNLVSGNPRKSGLVANGGQTADDIHFSFVGRYKEAYRLELEHFVDLMTDPSLECKIKASDALRASFLAHAAEESARKGRVVRIDEHFKMLMEKYRDDPLLYE